MSRNSAKKRARIEQHRRDYGAELRKRKGLRPAKDSKKFWDDTPGHIGWQIEIRNKIAIARSAVERREQLTDEFCSELLKLVTDGLGFVKGGMVRNEHLVKNLAASAHVQYLAVQEMKQSANPDNEILNPMGSVVTGKRVEGAVELGDALAPETAEDSKVPSREPEPHDEQRAPK